MIKGKHVSVGTDGSDRAYAAFSLAMSEFLDKEDRITVISIKDSQKLYLDEKYQPKHIMLEYKNAMISNFL